MIACGFLALASFAHADEKPGVRIYATGGTIAGTAQSNTNTTDYKAGSLGIDILLNAVPEIRNVANVSGEQIANVASGNITSGILLTIAKAINTKLAENATQGVVIISEDV